MIDSRKDINMRNKNSKKLRQFNFQKQERRAATITDMNKYIELNKETTKRFLTQTEEDEKLQAIN
tara:strand:- start:6966 stop:7160 length:195 start_codon:yes stop_codon:yes gene_type:complete